MTTFPDGVPVLTDGRVTLRAHRAEDLEGMYEQCIDPETQRWTSVPSPYTRDDAAQFLARRAEVWESATASSFAVEADGGAGPSRFAGSIGIHNVGSGIGTIGFGAHPGVRGRGVMTAAVRLIVSWALDVQGLSTIVWEAIEGNTGSLRVAWKSGFTFEGPTRGRLPHQGQLVDGWRGTLLATDSRSPTSRWLEPVVLEDDRVRLRAIRRDDEQRYLETNNDPESLRWLGTIPFPRDAASFRRHFARRLVGNATGASIEWVVADLTDDRYVATVNLFGLHSLDYLSAEVGYRTHPDARGRGVLRAGLRLALGHAFTSVDAGGLGLQRVSLGAGDGNLGSQRLARSLGFTETGRDRQCYDLSDGSVVDLVRFDLLRPEFDASTTSAHP